MTPERWRQVTDVFHAAVARDAPARASYLDQACAGDRHLRDEVDAMLAAHGERASFPSYVGAGFSRPEVDASRAPTPRLTSDTMIGPYRVTQLIGPGGMARSIARAIRSSGATRPSRCCPPRSPRTPIGSCASSARHGCLRR